MYIKIDNEYMDGELNILSDLLSLLDGQIHAVRLSMLRSIPPESEGLADRGEYFIGVGFAAIQQYLNDTLILTGVIKRQAFDIGPRYSMKFSFISVVNAAANWWKHSSEWVGEGKNNSKLAMNTQRIVMDISDSEDYPLSNVLSMLLGTTDINLSALLPNIILWRSAIDKEKK
ncbi:hypothetical protein ACK3YY_04970 [Aeromonas caviae]